MVTTVVEIRTVQLGAIRASRNTVSWQSFYYVFLLEREVGEEESPQQILPLTTSSDSELKSADSCHCLGQQQGRRDMQTQLAHDGLSYCQIFMSFLKVSV